MVSHVSPQCGDGIELKFRPGMSSKMNAARRYDEQKPVQVCYTLFQL